MAKAKKKKKKGAEGGAAAAGGASTKSKSKRKEPEPEITLGEALIAFQVKVKEQSVEEFSEEVGDWQFKNDRLRERNKKMKAEQLDHIKCLLQQAKERDKVLYESSTTVCREQVAEAKRELVQAGKQAEQDIIGLHKAIKDCENRLDVATVEVDRLIAYRDVGQHEHQLQIEAFKKQLAEWDVEYDELRESLNDQKAASRQVLSSQTENVIARQRHTASDVAVSALDTKSHTEVHQRIQMRSEVAQLREEIARLAREVEDQEEKNLALVTNLWVLEERMQPIANMKRYSPESGAKEDVGASLPDPLLTLGDDDADDAEAVGSNPDGLLLVSGRAVEIHLSPEKANTPLRLPPLPMCTTVTHTHTNGSRPTSQESRTDNWPVTYSMLKSVVGVPTRPPLATTSDPITLPARKPFQ